MNSQVNNPLYQQFVELVSTASKDVIEECVQPLSSTLADSQKEINKIQVYAEKLEKQYVDIEKVVDTTSKNVLNETVKPIVLEFRDLNTKLNSAATDILALQKVVNELRNNSVEVKDKNQMLNSIVYDTNKKVFDNLVGPLQKEITSVVPTMKDGAVALLKLKDELKKLNDLLDSVDNKNNQALNQISNLKNEMNTVNQDLKLNIEKLVLNNKKDIDLKINEFNSKIEAKVDAIEIAQIGRSQMNDKYLMELKSKISNLSKGIDHHQINLDKKIKHQQYYIWALIGLVVATIFLK